MSLKDPLAEEWLPFIQGQIPMFGLTHHRFATTDS
ncbi:hypothetical protein EVA_05334 [gut metagenome]|uniref:Uncharacterized protein n=1 Tax=gut metagenome TaxID=749906 RepID=J9D1V2_9ZZZZ